MKRLTVLFAVFAVILGTASAFSPVNNHRFASQFYSYVGGVVTVQTSYAPLGAADPACPSTQELCAIRVKKDATNPNLPDSTALKALAAASNGFANAGDYAGLGKVEKKND